MTLHSREHCNIREAITSLVLCWILLAAVTSVIIAVTDLDTGRTFVLNPDYLPWEEAQRKCNDMNGSLGRIDQINVIPDLEYDNGWPLWIGLRVGELDNMTWDDGTGVNWTNWHEDFNWTEEDSACVFAMTSPPYSWTTASCNQSLPSLCEIQGGNCRFTVTTHASIQSFNNKRLYTDTDTCLEQCRNTREFDCRSVEVYRGTAVCHLSSENRWTQPRRFIFDYDWDYYHWTCINGTYLDGIYVSPSTTQLPTSTAPPVTSPVPTPTTEAEEEGEMVCVMVKPVQENDTQEVRKEVKELRTLSLVYKEQKKMKKKMSRPDPRPSATYVGSLAVGLVMGVLGIIVCLDLVSLPRHISEMNRRGAPCGRCVEHRKKKKRKKRLKRDDDVKFSEYSERPTTRPGLGPLVISTKVSHNFRPNGLSVDEHVEKTYSNGVHHGARSGKPLVNKKVELHLERIRRLEREVGRRSGQPESGPSTSADERKVADEEEEEEEEEEEVVCVETVPDDSDCSAVPHDYSYSGASAECVVEVNADGVPEEETELSGPQSVTTNINASRAQRDNNDDDDDDDDDNHDADSCTRDSLTPDAPQELASSSSAAEEEGSSIFSSANIQQGRISDSGAADDSQGPHADDKRKDRMHSRERFKDVNAWRAQTGQLVHGQTEVDVESQGPESASLSCRVEQDVCQEAKTSDTLSDNGNSVSSVSGLQREQVHIEIRIEEDEASASDTMQDCRVPVNVDNNRLKVETYPNRLGRGVQGKAVYSPAWFQ